MLRLDINVSILLREYAFGARFDQAARLGFRAVEFWWPAGEDRAALARRIRDAQLEVALFNFDAGDLAAGERGLLNDPARDHAFRANVPAALELAHAVGCTRINALVGRALPGQNRATQLERARENLRWAAQEAAAAGVTVVVESLNTWETPGYLLANTRDTLAFLDSVGAPNLGYQFDVYHMQRMEGNIIATIREHLGRIAHVQLADAPDRGQPGSGELHFRPILEALDAGGYTGWVGLEYAAHGTTADSLRWLPPEGRVALDPRTLLV